MVFEGRRYIIRFNYTSAITFVPYIVPYEQQSRTFSECIRLSDKFLILKFESKIAWHGIGVKLTYTNAVEPIEISTTKEKTGRRKKCTSELYGMRMCSLIYFISEFVSL